MRRLYALLAVIGVSLFYGLATGFPLSYRLIYLLVGMVAGSLTWVHASVRGLRVSVERQVGRVQVGDVVASRIFLQNSGPLPKVWLEVQDAVEIPGQTTATVVTLLPGQSKLWEPRTPLLKRGLFNLGPVHVYNGDLFGLFRLRRLFGPVQPLVVYPRVVPLPALPVMAAEQVQQDVRHRRTPSLTPAAASVREYAHGDSLKRIHWPSTARTGHLMSKEFDSGMGGRAWVLVDLDRSVQAGGEIENTEEYAVTAASSIAAQYLKAGWPVGLAAQGDVALFLPAERTVATLDRLLYALATVRAQGQVPLAELLRQMHPLWTPSVMVVIITPSNDGGWVGELEHALRRGIGVRVVLLDVTSFGGAADITPLVQELGQRGVPTYLVRRGEPLEQALSGPREVRMEGTPSAQGDGSHP